jgi:four helix bundle protein
MQNAEKGTAPAPRDLKARTRQYALSTIRLFGLLPRTAVAQVLGRQMLRSGTSVGANFREAQRARSKPELVAKMNLSLMELEESSYWLELLDESQAAGHLRQEISALQVETGELCAIFVTLIKRAKNGGQTAAAE